MRRFSWLCVVLSLTASSALGASSPSALDWSAWDTLPVVHEGRVMPLDTFARDSVREICGREKPTFDLSASMPAAELKSEAMAPARSLFPGDKPRQFKASELLLSWLIEPSKWEDVPFIEAKHEGLREMLELPLKNEAGEALAFVSPNQLKNSDGFQRHLMELAERQRAAQREGQEPRMSEAEKKLEKVWRAVTIWKRLVLAKSLDSEAMQGLQQSLSTAAEAWQQVAPELNMIAEAGGEKTQLQQPVEQAKQAFLQLAEAAQKPTATLTELEAPARQFASAAANLAQQFAGLARRMAEHPPADWEKEKQAALLARLEDVAGRTKELAMAAARVERALYENGEWLRVVPALNAAALEKDREADDRAEPWLDLETLLYGTPAALAGYPPAAVQAVRDAFTQLAAIYPERDARPNDFAAATQGLSRSLRTLGEEVEPLRDKLDLKERDDDLIAYTRYPAASVTATEVRYNRLQPFQWSWAISFLSLWLFGAYMIGVRRRGLFYAGLAVLFFGLAWAVYGFYLRVIITGWAPVTNMYETLIYTAFFVTALGAWFTLLPVTWPGLQNAWRLSAAPPTWEATELSADQLRLMPRGRWNGLGWLLQIPRLALAVVVVWALTMADYAAGGRKIINLLPNIDAGQSLPDFNDLMTWGVGLVILLPTVWYLPRAFATALAFPLVARRSLGVQRDKLFEQVYARWPFCVSATMAATLGGALASFAPMLDSGFGPLTPVLRDNFWLLIHVLTIVSSYAAGALAWGIANIALAFYLFGAYRAPEASGVALGHRPAGPAGGHSAFVGKRPPAQTAELSSFVYRGVQVAVVLLAAGTLLGALWADVAWGRFWGWDPKEVWALVSLLVYLAILHGRYAGMFGNFGLCVGAVLGFTAIIMSWYGVNFWLGVGLHSYGFGAGGQYQVLGGVGLNWLLMLAAVARYQLETKGTVAFWRGSEAAPTSAVAEAS
ncbi:MAG: cytochrome c biogenesis protein CcsA [Pirellulales bacterium]|nr:cytochrome c biogenesis protein CcsA [Pirellulales bacterium]